MALQPMQKFFLMFDDVQNKHPHVLFDMGYNRISDWIITIWDAEHCGIRNAKIIVQSNGTTRNKAFKRATKSLRKWASTHKKGHDSL